MPTGRLTIGRRLDNLPHCYNEPSMALFVPNRYRGKLIVVEGIDGSGKSTQISLLSHWLRSQGFAVAFSEWNSSPLVRETTRRGKKKEMLTPTTFSLIHA